jgi:hypothetical protein
MALPKTLAIAAATAATATIVAGAAFPQRDALTPQAEQRQANEQLARQKLEDRKGRVRQGMELGDALARDRIRAAEIRRATADGVARGLLRRLP